MGTDPQRFLLSGIEDEVSFKANLIFPRKRCICRYFKAESSFIYVTHKGNYWPAVCLFECSAHIALRYHCHTKDGFDTVFLSCDRNLGHTAEFFLS